MKNVVSKSPVRVVAAVIHRLEDERVLLVRRGPGQSGAGSWEFPGGKVELQESDRQALRREIEEELGLLVEVRSFVGEELYQYPSKTIRLCLYHVMIEGGVLNLTEHDASEWRLISEIDETSLSPADRPFVARLQGNK